MVREFSRFYLIAMIVLTISACASTSKKGQKDKVQVNLVAVEARAESAYREGQLELAEGLYRKLLAEKTNYAPAWFRLGNIYTRTNRLEAAVNAYQNCISSDKEFAKAWHNLAIVHVRQATDILIEAQNHLIVDTSAKTRMDQLFLELMRIQSNKMPENTVVSND